MTPRRTLTPTNPAHPLLRPYALVVTFEGSETSLSVPPLSPPPPLSGLQGVAASWRGRRGQPHADQGRLALLIPSTRHRHRGPALVAYVGVVKAPMCSILEAGLLWLSPLEGRLGGSSGGCSPERGTLLGDCLPFDCRPTSSCRNLKQEQDDKCCGPASLIRSETRAMGEQAADRFRPTCIKSE
jgi:hypothetical protein